MYYSKVMQKSLENKKSCVTDTNLQHLFVKMTLG